MPIEYSERFRREFKAKTPEMRGAIAECIKRVAEGDRSHGLRVKKMQGIRGVWEARVDKANRVTFERDGDVIRFRAHCNHDVLKRP